MKKSTTFIILYFVVIPAMAIGLFYGLFHLINAGVKLHEISECLTWEKHAEEYQLFYLTEWQDQQCRHHGIEIDAPVY